MRYSTAFKVFDPSTSSKLDLKPESCLSMIILKQIHSDIIIEAPDTELEGDASMTTLANTACTVLTADCLPLLVIDESLHKIGAIHAGWRGLASGIVEKTLSHFSSNARIIIAPSISAAVYEVGQDVISHFLKFPFVSSCYQEKSADKYLLDIRKIATHIIKNTGISSIIDLDRCTYSSRLPSYRRDKTSLRLASMVWIDG